MKIKIYSLLLFILCTFYVYGQQPGTKINLLGANSVAIIGTSNTNSTSLSINLPAGKDRVLIVWFYLERVHSSDSNNFPSNLVLQNGIYVADNFPVTLSPAINGNSVFQNAGKNSSSYYSPTTGSVIANTKFSNHQQGNVIDLGTSSVAQAVTVDYSSIRKMDMGSNDEMIVNYAIYENVSSVSRATTGTNANLEPRDGTSWRASDLANFTFNPQRAVIPKGRVEGDIVYVGSLSSSKTDATILVGSTANIVHRTTLSNAGGNLTGDDFSNENDGVSTIIYDFNRVSGSTIPAGSINISRQSGLANSFRVTSGVLLPLARPEYSGQVYVDNNGSTIGGATGKPAADYVYVIDNVTGKVIYKATVAADGKFVIYEGYIEESSSYTLQLSNVNVNVGDSKPATTLNPGYGYTRESLDNVSGNIENPGNGEITINNAGVTGINTIAFGVQGISAVNDSYAATATQGVSGVTFPGSVLTNDSFNGVVPTLSNVNITNIINPTSAGKPVPTLSASTGLVTVPPGTPAGTYTITYSICDKTDNVPCSNTATVTVVVPTTTIVADEDNFTSSPISSISGGTTTSIFANDNYNGGAEGSVNSTNSTLSQVGTWNTNFTLNADGTITVAAGTAPGSYVMNYRICDKINPTVCDDAQVTILVNATILADDDNYNVNSTTAIAGGNVGNILNNDNYNGGPDGSATVSNVIITSPAPTSATVPYINLATGDVVVPAGTPAGNYTINYTICDKVNGSPCDPAVVTVNVAAVTVQADDDNYSSTSIVSQNGGTLPSVLLNDNYNGGADGSATVGLAGNVNLSTVGTWTPGITLNSDGTIAVAPGTNPGTYTLTYRICDKVFPTICDDAQVTVVVALGYCFELPITNASQKVNTKHGITSLGRAYADGTNWPSVRQSAWTVLEAKTKGFVVNRVAFNSAGQPVGIAASNYVEGMMVYDTTNNCLKIYNGTVWSCFSTPACP